MRYAGNTVTKGCFSLMLVLGALHYENCQSIDEEKPARSLLQCRSMLDRFQQSSSLRLI